MPLDGLTIYGLATELNDLLLGARIDKIYQPEKDELSLVIRTSQANNIKLLISANARWARFHINTAKMDNPQNPPTFCMLLRKYLEGGRIVKVAQIDLERIVHIHIEAFDDYRELKTKVLVCEFMGKHSNIILVNPENNLIIDAIKKYGSDVSSHRSVLPGYEYISPPPQNKLSITKTDFNLFAKYMWEQDEELLKNAIFHVLSGVSPFTGEQLCYLTNLNPLIPVAECGEYELATIYNYILDLLVNIKNYNFKTSLIYTDKKPTEYAPYSLAHLSHTRYVEFDSINKGLDKFYNEKLNLVKLEAKKDNLSRQIKTYLTKAHKKQFHLESDYAKANKNHIYRIKGEVITANLYKLNKGDKEVELENYYTGEMIKITLDPRYTPNQNAQRFFKIYNKSQNALKHLIDLLANNEQEINYLESILIAIQDTDNVKELEEINNELVREGYKKGKTLPKKETPQIVPRKFTSSDGFEILVGKNNRQNDWLTLKNAHKNDLWFHTQNIPGTHVILKIAEQVKNEVEIPTTTLEEAAGLAAYYSKAQNSTKVPVDYTLRAHVKKPKGAKPGMVIYDNFKTITVNPQSTIILDLIKNSPN